MARQGWKISFERGDSFRERQQAHQSPHSTFRSAVATAEPLPPPGRAPAPRKPAAPPAPAEDRCARGDWCSGRVITIEGGVRTVTPAATPRHFCDACQDYIGTCLEDFPGLYLRLHRELAEHRQAEVMVRAPFGPSIPLNTAVDAQMRAMTETLCSWELRIRDLDGLSDLGAHENEPQDDLSDLRRSVAAIMPDPEQNRLSMLLSLAPQEMVRFMPCWAVPEGDQDSAEVTADNAGILKVTLILDGRRAGLEILHLHYLARRLLLETNPPMPLLPDFRCRVCEKKLLRKAPPPWHEDGEWFWSRCDGCGDECTREEYDTNAKRWVAYERARLETARLAG